MVFPYFGFAHILFSTIFAGNNGINNIQSSTADVHHCFVGFACRVALVDYFPISAVFSVTNGKPLSLEVVPRYLFVVLGCGMISKGLGLVLEPRIYLEWFVL